MEPTPSHPPARPVDASHALLLSPLADCNACIRRTLAMSGTLTYSNPPDAAYKRLQRDCRAFGIYLRPKTSLVPASRAALEQQGRGIPKTALQTSALEDSP